MSSLQPSLLSLTLVVKDDVCVLVKDKGNAESFEKRGSSEIV
jgi:hypothetical protein